MDKECISEDDQSLEVSAPLEQVAAADEVATIHRNSLAVKAAMARELESLGLSSRRIETLLNLRRITHDPK